MADKLNGIFIAEILADNADVTATDTDGDGNTNKSDEFIELQNSSGGTVSLAGYEVWSETNGLLFAFDASDTLAPGQTATVVGNYSGSVPSGYYDAGNTEGANWIPDGEGSNNDTIFLVDRDTGEYITLSYGQPPTTPVPPPTFPGTTQIGSGETINSGAPNGTAFARDSNGDLIETTPTPGSPDVPCFASGTLIRTKDGDLPIETLIPGQHVLTRDAGFQPIIGLRRTACPRSAQLFRPSLRPVICPAGSLGATQPLVLSRSHTVLVCSAYAELLFGTPEVLIAAHMLKGLDGIHVSNAMPGLVYHHLLFDTHQVVRANGVWTESLFLSETERASATSMADWDWLDGITVLPSHDKAARRVLRAFEAGVLLDCLKSRAHASTDLRVALAA